MKITKSGIAGAIFFGWSIYQTRKIIKKTIEYIKLKERNNLLNKEQNRIQEETK